MASGTGRSLGSSSLFALPHERFQAVALGEDYLRGHYGFSRGTRGSFSSFNRQPQSVDASL